MSCRRPLPFLLAALLSPTMALAHPMPDIPVRSYFSSGGKTEIRVEIDPRAFKDDPEAYDYFTKSIVDALSGEQFSSLVALAERFLSDRVRFHFEPQGTTQPKFAWEFRKLGDAGSLAEDEDPAVLVGTWKTDLPARSTGYHIESLHPAKEGSLPMNVVFQNHFDGKRAERYAVLFPGESSFTLDLTSGSSAKTSAP